MNRMLESLIIRNCATYDNEGIEITNLKKINFIYGANGSGKTTITKFVANPESDQYKDCTKGWKNGIRIRALVYNKDFRELNFGKGTIDGVFTLGQATKEEIEDIQRLQDELKEVKTKSLDKKIAIERLEAEKSENEDAFREAVWKDVYKKYEEYFKEAFSGVMKSALFKEKLLQESANEFAELKTIDELKEKATTIFGSVPIRLPSIPTIDFARITEIENDPLWKKKIIGKADVEIAGLIQRLNLNDWVNEGRDYLQDDETCPFCQQATITPVFRRQLEEYFDETFTKDTNRIRSLSEEYERLTSDLINLLEGIESAEKENADSKLDELTFTALLKTLSSQRSNNQELVKNKTKEASRSIDLVSTFDSSTELETLIIDANKQVSKHNDLVTNYAREKALLVSQIWRFLAENYKSEIEAFNKKTNGLQKGLDKLKTEKQQLEENIHELQEEIRIKNKNVTSVQPSVDEINRTLRSFGFTNFVIVPSSKDKNQYQIQREDGSLANTTLSEGEVTFITFLYFLQLSKGSTSEESVTDERILVIDDPISSLDSNVLFIVSSLLKEIIKGIKAGSVNIKQFILLTHNVYFHKEVTFTGREPKDNDRSYWILRRNQNRTSIQSYGMDNPVKNSYELLWQELINREQNSGTTTQNTMRRIIEYYFKILGKFRDDELIDFFTDAEEKQICRSLICWINDGSHAIPDDLYVEHQEDLTDKYLSVFERIFEKTNHKEHYQMMMGQAK